jgi:hypothetical protein
MSHLIDEAIAEIQKLPVPEQETFAAWILAELASERRWAAASAKSEDVLAQWADEALAEHRAGRTHPLDLDELSRFRDS